MKRCLYRPVRGAPRCRDVASHIIEAGTPAGVAIGGAWYVCPQHFDVLLHRCISQMLESERRDRLHAEYRVAVFEIRPAWDEFASIRLHALVANIRPRRAA